MTFCPLMKNFMTCTSTKIIRSGGFHHIASTRQYGSFAELFPDLKEKMHMVPHGHMLDYVEPADKEESRKRLGIPNDKLVFLFLGR